MAVFSETSPPAGRRNALPYILEGVTAETLAQLRLAREEAVAEPQAESQETTATTAAAPDLLDIIHSRRYRQRRNAIVTGGLDTQSLHHNHFHVRDSANHSMAAGGGC